MGETPPRYEQATAGTSQKESPVRPTRTNPPTRGGGGRQERQPQNCEATQPLKQGRQPASQARPRATPTRPIARTPRHHPAKPNIRPQPEKADNNGHAATDGQEERPPRTGRHTRPPGKRQTTNHGDADTTRTIDRETKPQRKGGGDQGDHGRSRQQDLPPQPTVDHNTKEQKATPT